MKHNIKINRAIEMYTGFKGSETMHCLLDGIPKELIERLTAKELSIVMLAMQKQYQEGKKSTGAEMIDNNAVYIDKLDKVIEWNEVGAKYEYQEVINPAKHYIGENGKEVYIPESKSRVPVKVKNGVLTPKFS